MPADEIEEMKTNDAEKVREAYQAYKTDSRSWSVASVVESILWTCTGIAVIGMVVAMPWVGVDKPIPGATWIGLSTGSIVLFATAAVATRYVREDLDTGAVDKSVEQKFSRR